MLYRSSPSYLLALSFTSASLAFGGTASAVSSVKRSAGGRSNGRLVR